MEIFFLNLFAFLRPILFIEVDLEVAGLGILEIAAILLALLLLAMLLYKMFLKKKIYISSIDILIIFFTLWCIATYLAYPDDSDVKKVVKLILPLWTFIIAKNVIVDRNQFKRLTFVLLVGYSIPLILSVLLILTGNGIGEVNYWTGIARFKGAYINIHTMGHNMAFVLMMIVTYLRLGVSSLDSKVERLQLWEKLFFAFLVILACYCLYHAWVRTTVLGLLIFFTVYLFNYNRKILFLTIAGSLVLGIIFAPVIVPRFFNDIAEVLEGERDIKRLGSGRVRIWTGSIENYIKLPLDRKIAGNGIGNESGGLYKEGVDTHSDLLGLFEEIGAIGFILYMLLQFFILKTHFSDAGSREIFVSCHIFGCFCNEYS